MGLIICASYEFVAKINKIFLFYKMLGKKIKELTN